MTDPAVLKDLRESVRRAKGPSRELNASILIAVDPDYADEMFDPLASHPSTTWITSSLDAAIALVERVLPGTARIGLVQNPDKTWNATILWVEPDDSECPQESGRSAPLALLEALLSALLIAQQEPTHVE
jgi:hypothetical protein